MLLVVISDILFNTLEGRSLLEMRDDNVPLSETNSRILTDKIVDYYIQNEIKMTVDDADNIAEEIVMNFPQELKVINQ